MTPDISEAQKREYLERVLTSRIFARSRQLRELLTWLSRYAFTGAAAPTEYEVGVGALRRPPDFDPQTDSLVRKEMSRLRAKLSQYYIERGGSDPIRITCEEGYGVTFKWALPAALPHGGDGAAPLAVLILPLYASPGLDDLGNAFYEELLAHLSGLHFIELIAQTTARYYTGRFGDIRAFAEETGADIVIEGTTRRRADALLTTLWLVDGRTGRSHQRIWFIESDPTKLGEKAMAWIRECCSETRDM